MQDPTFHVYIIGCAFILAGLLHFIKPKAYIRIMPDYIPSHRTMVYISGVAEIAGGVGIMIPLTQTAASWALIVLLIVIFPANINMTARVYKKRGLSLYTWLTILRLPLQFLLIYWVYWAGLLK